MRFSSLLAALIALADIAPVISGGYDDDATSFEKGPVMLRRKNKKVKPTRKSDPGGGREGRGSVGGDSGGGDDRYSGRRSYDATKGNRDYGNGDDDNDNDDDGDDGIRPAEEYKSL